MSILSDLFNSLTGGSAADKSFTPPSSLCPGSCPLAPDCCEECLPYKEKLKDALYQVEHLDEFLARYEVVSSTEQTAGTTTCPFCGAPSANPFVCEYCGSTLAQDSGKIRVASANDIPDPIIEARDIIYARHSAIVDKVNEANSSGGLLSALFGPSYSSILDDRMSKEEIQQAAELYKVSVSTYLNGLDNGTYLTLSRKKSRDASEAQAAALSAAGGVYGVGYATGNQRMTPPPPPPQYRPMQPPSRPMTPPQPSRPMQQPSRPTTPPQQSRPAQQPSRPTTPPQQSRPAQQPSRPTTPPQQNRPAQQPSRPTTPPQQSRPTQQPSRPTTPPQQSRPAQQPSRPTTPPQQSRPAQQPSRPSTPSQQSRPAPQPGKSALPTQQTKKPQQSPPSKPSVNKPGGGSSRR